MPHEHLDHDHTHDAPPSGAGAVAPLSTAAHRHGDGASGHDHAARAESDQALDGHPHDDHTHDGHAHEHDGHEEHGHEHSHGSGIFAWVGSLFRPHSHDAADSLDDALAGSEEGIRTVRLSLLGLGITALVQ